ncbi:M20 peptidase aminoacylase family protein [Halalkalibacter akibai]|uniref:Amidohydrolase n=1 Tax=Halalkalibacter akibai (strain ATCC 43226 / DSM 21942 / CIP 109018 / JCM 9157 / 1139) TaxID=1236973 RepID=W4QZ03_HALA3|nr:M20 peptidase aminoacylase family protein [Halalkalibacter akibai]GAE37375.1 amidohydrolase [Halalkalibacter akibai JCM 9157]
MRTIRHIFEWIDQYQDQLEETYQHLHSIAEVSWEEKNTTKYLAAELEKLNIPYETFPEHTGLVGTWIGSEDGPVVAVRADIDALWQNVDGVWKANHSCGHDGHATIALYSIKLLKEIGFTPKGIIKIIFQPAEETGQGAKALIRKGVVEDVNYLLGLHLRPIQELQIKQAAPAIYHGATRVLQGKVKGIQAHAARPHLGVNVLDSIAAIINAINSIKMDPTISSSAKVTMVRTEGKNLNIIPDEAIFGIDLRTQTNEIMDDLVSQVTKAVFGAASFNGAEVELETVTSLMAAVPDRWMEEVVQEAITEVLGEGGTFAPIVTPGGEDFHYYPVKKSDLQATMIGLGADLTPGLHHPQMTFNPSALQDGVAIMSKSVIKIFEKHERQNI